MQNTLLPPGLMPEQYELAALIEAGHVAKSGFSLDISSKPLVSDKQRYWVRKLRDEGLARCQTNSSSKIDLSKIKQMLDRARGFIKYPKIRLNSHGQEIIVSRAGDESANPGAVYVKVSGEYVGKITPSGEVRIKDESILTSLQKLASDPEKVASTYGKQFGACCFCSKEITTEESLAVGYGPVCADRYGLQWG